MYIIYHLQEHLMFGGFTGKNKSAQSNKTIQPLNFFGSSSSANTGNIFQTNNNPTNPFIYSATPNFDLQKKQQKNSSLSGLFNVHNNPVNTKKQLSTQQQANVFPQTLSNPFLFGKKQQSNNLMTQKKVVQNKPPSFLFATQGMQTGNIIGQAAKKQTQAQNKQLFNSATNRNRNLFGQAPTLGAQTTKIQRPPVTWASSVLNIQTNRTNNIVSNQQSQQKNKLIKQINDDLLKRIGIIEGIQNQRRKLNKQKEQNKQKIIQELKKQKNNITLNNNNILQVKSVQQRIKQVQYQNNLMNQLRKKLEGEINQLNKKIQQQQQKNKSQFKIQRSTFPQIKPSMDVKQILQKVCKFLPSNKIRDNDLKLKKKRQLKVKLQQQTKQLQQNLKELQKRLLKRQEQFKISQNQIINILDDQQQLKSYINNYLKPRRRQLQENYKKLKEQIKQLKKKETEKSIKSRQSRGLSLIL